MFDLVRGCPEGGVHRVIDEADRSIHDALCVIMCLVKKR